MQHDEQIEQAQQAGRDGLAGATGQSELPRPEQDAPTPIADDADRNSQAAQGEPAETAELPCSYYIDFENVHGPGLKGVDALSEHDEVFIFYSQAAETFHIEHAIDIMKSKARIEFVEIDGGTRNSLDFQLVAALFGTMEEGRCYAIVSGDGGIDAAIRMGKRLELPEVRRITDLTGSTEPAKAKSSRRSKSRQGDHAKQREAAEAAEKAEDETGRNEKEGPAKQEGGEQAEPKRSRRRSRQRRLPAQEGTGGAEATAEQQKPEADAPESGKSGQGAQDAPHEHDPSAAKAAKRDEGVSDGGRSARNETGAGKAPVRQKLPEGKKPEQLPAGRQGAETAQAQAAAGDAAEGAAPERSGRYSKRKEIKALLADAGAKLDQQQLSSVMSALNGVKNKQQFYQRIVKGEGRERGLELYRQVRDHYEAMVDILK